MTASKQTLKPIPTFRSEGEERRFWETHDSAAHFRLTPCPRQENAKPDPWRDTHDEAHVWALTRYDSSRSMVSRVASKPPSVSIAAAVR